MKVLVWSGRGICGTLLLDSLVKKLRSLSSTLTRFLPVAVEHGTTQ
jgi:hypothetical protein